MKGLGNNKVVFYILLLCGLCSGFIGCSLSGDLGLGEGIDQQTDAKNPIIISLSQGYVAGTVLHLRVQLELLDEIKTDSVYVQLKGLKEGVVKEEQTLPVSNVAESSILIPGSKIFLPFTLSIGDIDRFTISCLWGEAGYKLGTQLDLINISPETTLNKSEEITLPVKISELKVTEFELPCVAGICSIRVNLEGRVLRGRTDTAVKSVALAYKLQWVPDGELPAVSPNSSELAPDEKLLPFGDELLPIEGFEFKVDGEKDLPKVPGGRFMPVVRILRYETL